MFYSGVVAILAVSLLSTSCSSPANMSTYSQPACISTYRELEESILSNDANVRGLINGFFPINRQKSTIVDVTYNLGYCNDSNSNNSNSYQECDNTTQRWYKFRSTRSPVHNFIRPALLKRLSLLTYEGETRSVSLSIDPFCMTQMDGGEVLHSNSCKFDNLQDTNSMALTLLNEVTIWLYQYANCPQSILEQGADYDSNGFSVFLYGDKSQDSCTLGDDYTWTFGNRLVTYLAVVYLLIFAVTLPYILKKVFKFLTSPNNSNLSWQVWLVFTATTVLNLTLFGFDMVTIIQRGFLEPSEADDVRVYYRVATAALIILPLIIGVSSVFTILCTAKSNTCIPTFIHSFPMDIMLCFSITVTVEFLSFHFIYIAIGFSAAPLQVATWLFLYISFIIYATIWMAFLLNFLYVCPCCSYCACKQDESPPRPPRPPPVTPSISYDPSHDHSPPPDQPFPPPAVHQVEGKDICYHFTLCTFVLGVCLFISGLFTFIIIQSLHVLEYENTDGVTGYIGAITPPLIATFVAFALAKPKQVMKFFIPDSGATGNSG